MLSSTTEPRNVFYILLLLVACLFVMTALATAVIPVLEQKAAAAGQLPPQSAFRDALRKDGWRWLLYQAVALAGLAIASMALDRLRRMQKDGQPVAAEEEADSLTHPAPPASSGNDPLSGQ